MVHRDTIMLAIRHKRPAYTATF